MSYRLKEVKIQTDNTPCGMQQIGELWRDILNGVLPVLFDTDHSLQQGILLVAKYSDYEQNEQGTYSLTIAGVSELFFQQLEIQLELGRYKKYVVSDESGDVTVCTRIAWQKVWLEQKTGIIQRAFTVDYESSVPTAWSKDGKAHCTLYIAVKKAV